MEEKVARGEIEPESKSTDIKAALMGPLSGISDSIFPVDAARSPPQWASAKARPATPFRPHRLPAHLASPASRCVSGGASRCAMSWARASWTRPRGPASCEDHDLREGRGVMVVWRHVGTCSGPSIPVAIGQADPRPGHPDGIMPGMLPAPIAFWLYSLAAVKKINPMALGSWPPWSWAGIGHSSACWAGGPAA